jgi:exodeoxyribonuclease VII small subunit
MSKTTQSKNIESKSTDFATTLAELEKVVTQLDSDIPIEKALTLFEQGMQLSNECEKFLSAAEQKVEILKRTANGAATTEPFAIIADSSEDED